MGLFQEGIKRIVIFQEKRTYPLFAVAMAITVFLAMGLPMLRLQTDFNKEMPQDIPIMRLNNRINDKFSGQDTMIVIMTLDEKSIAKTALRDIRDPSVIQYFSTLEESLNEESEIVSAVSPATFLKGIPIMSPEMAVEVITNSPANAFVSRDFKTAVMYVTADTGSSDEKVIALDKLINDNVNSIPNPPGTIVSVTGTPQIFVTLFELLGKDAFNTIIYASLIIIFLLFILQRSFSKGLLVFTPLAFGLIWTYGTLGWMNVKISIATAGLGAIILGLGVEYGVFMITRYREERDKDKSMLSSLTTSVPAIGRAIIGSGTTTMVGFLALAFSAMPMIQNLGLSLALGIFFSLIATVFLLPIIVIIEEEIVHKYCNYRNARRERKPDKGCKDI